MSAKITTTNTAAGDCKSTPDVATTRPVSPWPIVSQDERLFTQNYNHASFRFGHQLGEQSAFGLRQLAEYAQRVRLDTVHITNEQALVQDGWGKSLTQRRTLLELLENLEQNNALIVFKNIGEDDAYHGIVESALGNLAAMVGAQLLRDMLVGRGTLLVASPQRITPYHFDADTNFLFQIRSAKTLYVFHPSVVTNDELERYYNGDLSAGIFREELQQQAIAYDLDAGLGVHIPLGSPHWAQNHAGVSVALSVNYDLRSDERRARLYRLNSRLRKLGIQPRAPGASRERDALKIAALDGAHYMRRLWRSERRPSDPG